VKDLEIQNM
jgi:hypothetical protein